MLLCCRGIDIGIVHVASPPHHTHPHTIPAGSIPHHARARDSSSAATFALHNASEGGAGPGYSSELGSTLRSGDGGSRRHSNTLRSIDEEAIEEAARHMGGPGDRRVSNDHNSSMWV